MTIRLAASLSALALCLAACSDNVATPAPESKPTPSLPNDRIERNTFDLPLMFDCLREEGGAVIAAHRGGPYSGYPENAIETLQNGYDHGVRVFEIDIAESQDGVLFLMHDRTLTRTTTGEGFLAEQDWIDIKSLNLVDNDGAETDFHPPTLREALDWAVRTGAILELDKKPTTSFRNIISEVREAGAENNILMISYSDEQALEIASIAPDLMMTASVKGKRDIAKLTEGGVIEENLIAWTGTDTPDEAAWARVRKEGVEPAFGTLGRKGESLDSQYLADGDGAEFQTLVDQGLVLIATDAPLEVARFIDGDDIAKNVCGL